MWNVLSHTFRKTHSVNCPTYCKTDASETEIIRQQKNGEEQIKEYLNSHRLGNRPDLKAAVIVLIGKNKYRIIEI
jgi:hypothetical protein